VTSSALAIDDVDSTPAVAIITATNASYAFSYFSLLGDVTIYVVRIGSHAFGAIDSTHTIGEKKVNSVLTVSRTFLVRNQQFANHSDL